MREIVLIEAIDIELTCRSIVLSGQIKASEDHRTRSKLLHSALYLRPTYDKLSIACPALLLLSYDRQGVERKQTAAGHTVEKFPSLLFYARKFKLIFLNIEFTQKNTDNPKICRTPHFMEFSKLYRPLLILVPLKRLIYDLKSINGPALLCHSNSIRQ